MNHPSRKLVLLAVSFFLAMMPAALAAPNYSKMKRVTQKMVAPPFLPKHSQVAKGKPKIVKVRLVIEEKKMEVAGGAVVNALTFNGFMPGPMIVVHQNDYVELTLVNPSKNKLMHNIDLHAATGGLGGATLTKVNPGQSATIRFKATKAGVFVYHCAPGGVMIPFHVVSGMNGAIMVLPRGGLKDERGKRIRYDKAYYIGEQDLYLPSNSDGSYKSYGSAAEGMGDMMNVMKKLTPTHVVFNGKAGALTGKNALTAKVGQRVLFIHSQANRDSRPHLIGGHADQVWHGGSFSDKPGVGWETWFVPGGSAVAAMYKFRQPGIYVYLSHNLIEAVMLGAAAHVSVTGKWNKDLLSQIKKPSK